MKIVIAIILAITLAVSFGIWKLTSDTRLLNSRVNATEKVIAAIRVEARDLNKYKDEEGLPLDKFYFELFNDIKEISFYYHASSEIKVPGAKDLVNIADFFKPSQYKGIRCVDVSCRIDLKDLSDTYLFEALYKIIRNKPIDILDVEIEKGAVNLTIRLYGP